MSVIFLPNQIAASFIIPNLSTSCESSALSSLAVGVHQMGSPQRKT